jgi:hypothetical protein
MVELVDPQMIEVIVGASRHRTLHFGRAVSAEERVYILHSVECSTSQDVKVCEYSLALDKGIDEDEWVKDLAVVLRITEDGRLMPDG